MPTKPRNTIKQVRIVSEGTGMDSHVQLLDGTVLYPKSAAIFIDAGDVNRVTLDFVGGTIDVTAVVSDATLICPVCEHSCTHECNNTLGGPHKHD